MTEPRRSDSELAEMASELRSIAHDVGSMGDYLWRPDQNAENIRLLDFQSKKLHEIADRLSEYADLESKLPTVTCPTCGGRGSETIEDCKCDPEPHDHSYPCTNPDCDGGTVRLTLADAVAITAAVFQTPANSECPALLAYLRSVRA